MTVGPRGDEIFNQQRIDVPVESVSTYFMQALVSVEDQRFYEHGAIDPRRIFLRRWLTSRRRSCRAPAR